MTFFLYWEVKRKKVCVNSVTIHLCSDGSYGKNDYKLVVEMTCSMKFEDNSNILISGSSSSGKTTLIQRLLLHSDKMFVSPPSLILFVYNTWHDIYEQIEKNAKNIIFMEQLPTEDELVEHTSNHKHSIFVADDKMEELMNNKFGSDLFTRNSHHYGITTILLLQNCSSPGKYKSNIMKNAHYSILLRSPRDFNSVRTLGIQLGDYRNLVQCYEEATSQRWGYLCCDTHPISDPQFRYRTNIFPDDDLNIVYKTG